MAIFSSLDLSATSMLAIFSSFYETSLTFFSGAYLFWQLSIISEPRLCILVSFSVPDWPHFPESAGFRGIRRIPRIPLDSAEHTAELNHSRARLNPQESDGIRSRNPEERTSDLRGKDPIHDTSATILPCCLFHIIRHRRRLRRQLPYAARDIPSK